jgi:hypothetical protein
MIVVLKNMVNQRVKDITRLYYSNPKIQEVILNFAGGREVVPSYMMESFGKRPDILIYPSDVMGAVNRGATSFHASEEIWEDPLQINSDMSYKELNKLRKGWDLLIDIDSPYLDYSKIAARLLLEALESYGINDYGVKFSGSKGFHLIVSGKAFPDIFEGGEKKKSFPEWPRAICEFLMSLVRKKYNKELGDLGVNFDALEKRQGLKKEDVVESRFSGGEKAIKGVMVTLKCDRCGNFMQRPNMKITKRKIKCVDEGCPGRYEIDKIDDYFYSEGGTSSFDKRYESNKKIVYSNSIKKDLDSEEVVEEIEAEKLGSLDLVLVASRHLFRMPYSLHEKTALASVVLEKDEIDGFKPGDADPFKVKIKEFLPNNKLGEGERLLAAALEWKRRKNIREEGLQRKKYSEFKGKRVDLKDVSEDMFPKPIKKLLKGLQDGKKRGLFILLTFLKSCGFSPEEINEKVRGWNKKNEQPLKEGYVRSQIEWHLKQNRKILPPNYSNGAFYKDLGLLDGKEKTKNPLVDVARKVKEKNY